MWSPRCAGTSSSTASWPGGRVGVGGGDAAAREAEARERDLATEEAERSCWFVRRQHKELRARIAEVACAGRALQSLPSRRVPPGLPPQPPRGPHRRSAHQSRLPGNCHKVKLETNSEIQGSDQLN